MAAASCRAWSEGGPSVDVPGKPFFAAPILIHSRRAHHADHATMEQCRRRRKPSLCLFRAADRSEKRVR